MAKQINRNRIIVGVVLIMIGLFFMFSQFLKAVFNIRIGTYTWPLAVLLPGLLLYLMAFITDEKTSKGLVVAGSLIGSLGLVLAFQNLTGLWASWAYAWSLIFPTGVGAGQMIYATLRGDSDLMEDGWGLFKVGGVIFLIGMVFFELVIGLSGFRFFGLRGFCFPALVIFAGLAIIAINLLPGRRGSQQIEQAAGEPAVTSVEPPVDTAEDQAEAGPEASPSDDAEG
jgi:hypothetical protein